MNLLPYIAQPTEPISGIGAAGPQDERENAGENAGYQTRGFHRILPCDAA